MHSQTPEGKTIDLYDDRAVIGIRQILAVRAEKTPDAVLFQYKNKKQN